MGVSRSVKLWGRLVAYLLALPAALGLCSWLFPDFSLLPVLLVTVLFTELGLFHAEGIGDALFFSVLVAVVAGVGLTGGIPIPVVAKPLLLAAACGLCCGKMVSGISHECFPQPISFDTDSGGSMPRPSEQPLHEYERVRVARLRVAGRPFDGTAPVCRAPRVGDEATIVNVAASADGETVLTAEMVDADGSTIWLADFASDELRRLDG